MKHGRIITPWSTGSERGAPRHFPRNWYKYRAVNPVGLAGRITGDVGIDDDHGEGGVKSLQTHQAQNSAAWRKP